MLMACAGAGAQSISTGFSWKGSIYSAIPAQFTADKRVKTIYTDDNTLKICDDFKEVKSIDLHTPIHSYYYVTRERERTVVKEGSQTVSRRKYATSDEWVKAKGIGYLLSTDTTMIFVASQQDFFDYDRFDTKYPCNYYLYDLRTNEEYEVLDRYVYKYSDWVETRTETGETSSALISLEYSDLDDAKSPDADMEATQTLFNNDDKYEYLRYKYEVVASEPETQDRDGDGENDWEFTYYNYKAKGFELVSEDGTVLQSIDFDCDIEMYGASLVKMNGNYYLIFNEYRGDSCLVYSIGQGVNAIRQVGALHRISVRPSLAERNAPITVETPAAQRDRRLTVTNAAGQTVWQQTIPAGQGSVQIDGRRLSRGLNIVNVEGDGKQDNSCKVIVK